MALGGMLVLVAALADRLGFGSAGSLGVGQVLLGALGVALLLVGLLGRGFKGFYKGLALVFVNTLVLLAGLELGSIVLGRLGMERRVARIEGLPYYEAQEWSALYWREARQAEAYRYEPYVLWRHRPFSGRTVSYDESGHRRVPGRGCAEGDVRLFTFGGSTMLGWGSPDWGTIPAYLQSGLRERTGDPVCVVNMAEDGYVSTQSTVELVLQLQAGNVPGLVVFYDGVNEVLAAHESGRPYVHVTLEKIASRFEQREHPLWRWYRSSRQYAVIVQPLLRKRPRSPVAESGLPHAVASTYLANLHLVQALSEAYGFHLCFFLQPHLGVGKKPLAPSERRMLESMDPEYLDLARRTYRAIRALAETTDEIQTLTDVFDDHPEQIWIDAEGHVTPRGNELVSQAMLSSLLEALALARDDSEGPDLGS